MMQVVQISFVSCVWMYRYLLVKSMTNGKPKRMDLYDTNMNNLTKTRCQVLPMDIGLV